MSRERPETRPLTRISMSLPEELLHDLDRAVAHRKLPSRSHAIALLLSDFVMSQRTEERDDIMFGTISLLYYNNAYDLPRQLADLQYHFIDEVINSLHVQLVRNQTMEIILLQGPAGKLRSIADEMIKLRGVIHGTLQLIGAVIPPLHSPTVLAVSADVQELHPDAATTHTNIPHDTTEQPPR